MPDLIHKLLNLIDHNRYAVVGVILAVAMLASAWGCEMTAASPISGEQLTRQEIALEAAQERAKREVVLADLHGQIAALQKRIEAEAGVVAAVAEGYQSALEQIEAKEAMIQRSLDVLGAVAREYAGPAVEPILLALGIGGPTVAGGFFLDNRRKDVKIKQNKEA